MTLAPTPAAAAVTVGVDLGGTKTAAGLVLPDGTIAVDCTSPTPAADGSAAVVDTVTELIERLVDKAAHSGLPEPIAVGIGSAGVIDADRGVVRSSTDHLAGWAGTPLAELVTARTGLPVRVINDVHAHAIGESRYGAGRGLGSVLVVAAGTGLGGSLVLGGVPVGGARHAAGHFGHVPAADAQDLVCSCGRTGHLETIASGPGLLALYRRRGGQASDARQVVANADSGEVLARDCLSITGRALGEAIGGWVNMLDPDAVVIAGGLAGAGPLWWSALTTAARAQYIDAVAGCPVLAARCGSSAAILGAAALAADLGRHGVDR